MALGIIAILPGGTAETDAQIMQQLGLPANQSPPGSIIRIAGPVEGGYRIISVWESQEQWDAFLDEKLLPLFERAGRPAPQFEHWPIETIMYPA